MYGSVVYIYARTKKVRSSSLTGLDLRRMPLVYTLGTFATQCPPVVLVWMTLTSYRVHSVFVLRLFNDPLAMVLLYMAIALFMSNRWAAGCILYRYDGSRCYDRTRPPLYTFVSTGVHALVE